MEATAVKPTIYTMSLWVREWRELLPRLTGEFKVQVANAISERPDTDSIRIRIDHLLK